jgi:hypothetical protein
MQQEVEDEDLQDKNEIGDEVQQ